MEKEKILVVVDMQNDFIDNNVLGTDEAISIVYNVRERIIRAREEHEKIIYTLDTHNKVDYPYSEEGKNLPIRHCISGTPGHCLYDAIFDVMPEDAICIEKNAFGAIQFADSDFWFGIDCFDKDIEIIGLCTDICVIANAIIIKSALPDNHIIVDAACCAGTSPENHDNALNTMKVMQVEVINQGKEPWRRCD